MGKSKLSIGITIAPAQDVQGLLWANGLSQNIVYLALLFQRLPVVAEVGLVCDSSHHPVADAYGLPLWTVEDAAGRCDVVVEFGSRSLGGTLLDQMRKRGGKLVSFVAGNVMAFNFESVAHGAAAGEILVNHRFDASWLLPQHWHMCRSYSALTSSSNVHQIPVLWDPTFLNYSAAMSRKNVFWRVPESGKYTLGCFDPNINVLKTFHLPLLVAEEAYRSDRSRIEKLLLFSTLRLKESRHVQEMILATDLGKDGKISLEDRHSLVHVIADHVQAVVTHQWENNRNYLYYEILYLGWPLIHNSPHLGEAGYYYKDFDPQDGGRVLVDALKSHPTRRKEQQRATRDVLWDVSIDNPKNQNAYSDLLLQVMDNRHV